jgi:hypothetical protein
MDESFINWVTAQVSSEDVKTWFLANNIIEEKSQLFAEFSISLLNTVQDTYLGDDEGTETSINIGANEMKSHFKWCWNKVIKDFEKEKIFFNQNGDHYEYFETFFLDVFYNQTSPLIRESIMDFIVDVFDKDVPFTKSDLKFYTDIYKLLDKNIYFLV